MTTAALTIAIISLVVAASSLTWQVVQFLLTAARVKVKAKHGYPLGFDSPDLLVVEASNHGRSDATIYGYGFEVPDGGMIFNVSPPPFTAKVPYRLEAGTEVSFHLLRPGVEETCRARGIKPTDLRPVVKLAGDRTVRGSKLK